MTPTERIVAASGQMVVPEFAPPLYPDCQFTALNSGSPEIEVCEFLYSLVRLIKPGYILETGTHYGISAAYMALAQQANAPKHGNLVTLEIDGRYAHDAQELFRRLEVDKTTMCLLRPSLQYDPGEFGETSKAPFIDLLFLDSEPGLRFNEFVKFFPWVTPGGFIMIHDLHPHLGHTNVTTTMDNGTTMFDWPYGDFRPTLGPYVKSHQVQTITFPAPRGFTLFQKAAPSFGATNLLQGSI